VTGLLAEALERAHHFLLAPASADARDAPVASATVPIAVGVVGLRRSSGASMVARGLTCAFESRAPVTSELVRYLRPEELEHIRVDVTVLVAPGDGEPALASIAAGLLRARVGRVVVVANRVRDPDRWSPHAAVCIPDSRLAAMLVARGRLPPGDLGGALVALATDLLAPGPV
jgi:hypothetical protein